MAKKQKRRASGSPSSVHSVNQTNETKQASRSFSGEFNPDYSYIIQDLKRIGTIAGTFIVILIALSFIIK